MTRQRRINGYIISLQTSIMKFKYISTYRNLISLNVLIAFLQPKFFCDQIQEQHKQSLKSAIEAPETNTSEWDSDGTTSVASKSVTQVCLGLTLTLLTCICIMCDVSNQVNNCTFVVADRLKPSRVARAVGKNLSRSGFTFEFVCLCFLSFLAGATCQALSYCAI